MLLSFADWLYFHPRLALANDGVNVTQVMIHAFCASGGRNAEVTGEIFFEYFAFVNYFVHEKQDSHKICLTFCEVAADSMFSDKRRVGTQVKLVKELCQKSPLIMKTKFWGFLVEIFNIFFKLPFVFRTDIFWVRFTLIDEELHYSLYGDSKIVTEIVCYESGISLLPHDALGNKPSKTNRKK